MDPGRMTVVGQVAGSQEEEESARRRETGNQLGCDETWQSNGNGSDNDNGNGSDNACLTCYTHDSPQFTPLIIAFLTFIGKKHLQGDEKQDINFALTKLASGANAMLVVHLQPPLPPLPPLLSLYHSADLQDETLRTIPSARHGQPCLDVLFHCHNSS